MIAYSTGTHTAVVETTKGSALFSYRIPVACRIGNDIGIAPHITPVQYKHVLQWLVEDMTKAKVMDVDSMVNGL